MPGMVLGAFTNLNWGSLILPDREHLFSVTKTD